MTYKIAFINEENFSDATERIFSNILANSDILLHTCLITSITPNLPKLLSDFSPNIIVFLGDSALSKSHLQKMKATDWRGSLLQCTNLDSPFFGYKCMPTFHPVSIMKNWAYMPLFRFDIARAREEGEFPELKLPQRNFKLLLTCEQVLWELDQIKYGDIISVDIEGGIQVGMTCISIATNPTDAFIIAFGRYSLEDEERIMLSLAKVLKNPNIQKILQHSLYDNFVLSWKYKCPIYGIVWDTMLSGWEIYPELPKGLGTQTSIWTKEPYYKFERKIDDEFTHYSYCCKDSAVTFEIFQKHQDVLIKRPKALQHFEFNMSLLPIMLYMELKGIKYDQEHASALHAQNTIILNQTQSRIDAEAGKKINLNSPKQLCDLLYNTQFYPVQHPKVAGRIDKTRQTSDVDALLTIARQYPDPLIRDILKFRKISKLVELLNISADADGRVRASYNIVGTDTGRLSCSKSPADTGMNLQTVTQSLRHLFVADDNYYMAQCDLAGADGWTVAARCAELGDNTMLLDYYAGIKPAKVIVLMYRHGIEVIRWSREKILEESKTVSEKGTEGWLYFTAKRIQHGTNYLLGINTMSDQILKDSYSKLGNPIYVSPKDCKLLQNHYINGRYQGVHGWQAWVKRELETKGELSCASGHVRKFFGRKTDHATFRSAASHEPQANTTYATNLAMSKLWQDPENRTESNALVIEPLHQVHDAIIVQFPQDKLLWALSKIRTYFNNPIIIGKTSLIIPFDGGWGKSWGELDNKI